MDLIDRQEVVNALEKVAGLFPYKEPGNRDSYNEYNEAWNDAIGRAEIEIGKLPSVQIAGSYGDVQKYYDAMWMAIEALKATQWIPVTERLPEKNGDYYVTYEKGYAEEYGFDLVGIAPYDADCEGFGIWQERYDPVSLGYLDSDFVDIKVTAWMPLPEPYTEND